LRRTSGCRILFSLGSLCSEKALLQEAVHVIMTQT